MSSKIDKIRGMSKSLPDYDKLEIAEKGFEKVLENAQSFNQKDAPEGPLNKNMKLLLEKTESQDWTGYQDISLAEERSKFGADVSGCTTSDSENESRNYHSKFLERADQIVGQDGDLSKTVVGERSDYTIIPTKYKKDKVRTKSSNQNLAKGDMKDQNSDRDHVGDYVCVVTTNTDGVVSTRVRAKCSANKQFDLKMVSDGHKDCGARVLAKKPCESKIKFTKNTLGDPEVKEKKGFEGVFAKYKKYRMFGVALMLVHLIYIISVVVMYTYFRDNLSLK